MDEREISLTMPVVVDIMIMEDCLSEAELGSDAWWNLSRRLIADIEEDARDAANASEANAGDVIGKAWDLYARRMRKSGRSPDLFIEASVISLADELCGRGRTP